MKITREKDKHLSSWVWKADFTYKGTRYRPQATKKEDLEEIVTQIRSNADRRGVGLDSRAPRVTVRQLLDEHIKTFDLTKKTHRRGKVVLESFAATNGDKAVESIGDKELHSFVRMRKSQSSLKGESVNKEVGYISAMFREAPNYFKALAKFVKPRMPWESVPKNTTQRVIYEDERLALLAHLRFDGLHDGEKLASRIARHEYADMFEIAYNTAMRWGEVYLLEWRMIDWRKAEANLPPEITKTKSGRIAYLNSRVIEILRRRKASSASVYVFPGKSPDRPRKYFYEGIRRAAKRIGLPFGRDVGFTLHSTRHSSITSILEATGDFAAAQRIGGHSAKHMTQKYAHTTAKRMRDAVEKLAEK